MYISARFGRFKSGTNHLESTSCPINLFEHFILVFLYEMFYAEKSIQGENMNYVVSHSVFMTNIMLTQMHTFLYFCVSSEILEGRPLVLVK